MAHKKEIIAKIKSAISANDRALYKALLIIYNRQTADEKRAESTIHNNGEGFTAFDADILTSFAHSYQRYQTLTPKQLNVARRLLSKYATQVFEDAVSRGVYSQCSRSEWERTPTTTIRSSNANV